MTTTEHELARRAEALARAATALAGELDLPSVLATIVETSRDVTRARYAALGVIGEDQMLETFIHSGMDAETVRRVGAYPQGKGILGLLVRDPRIIRLEDLKDHPASYGFPPEHPPMESFLGAPVTSGGRVFGNLYLTEKPGGFDETDESVILVLAAQAGAAIENAMLSAKVSELAVQEERDRISRDLHDGVIQMLFSVGMTLESASRLVATDPERVIARLDGAVDGIDAAIRELRNYIHRLQPGRAASMGLSRGLVELAREYEVNALHRPELALPTTLDRDVPTALVADLLQIAREALSNAAKHAHASQLGIEMSVDGGVVFLSIRDDGRGFTPGKRTTGRGLDNIRERVEVHDGKLEIDTSDAGTEIRVTIPLDPEVAP